MSDHIVVIPRYQMRMFMAAVADLEQAIDQFGDFTFWTDGEYGRGGGEEISIADLLAMPVGVLSKLASDVGQQADAQ